MKQDNGVTEPSPDSAPSDTSSSGRAAARRQMLSTGTGESPAGSTSHEGDVATWEPGSTAPTTARTPTTTSVLQRSQLLQVPPEIERAVLDLLTRPVDTSCGHEVGHSHREREIGEMFARLDVATAHALGKRLDAARFDDVLVTSFIRLTAPRRNRLRSFLADARRRAITQAEPGCS